MLSRKLRTCYRTYTTISEFSKHAKLLRRLDLDAENQGVFFGKWVEGEGPRVQSINPVTNNEIASVRTASPHQVKLALDAIEKVKYKWRETPAPVRGEIVRQMRVALNEKKEDLGALVSLEMGIDGLT
jgi:aldehyde dehydrogenase family 7 protein A1